MLNRKLDEFEAKLTKAKQLLKSPQNSLSSSQNLDLPKTAEEVRVALQQARAEAAKKNETLSEDIEKRAEKLLKEEKEIKAAFAKLFIELISSVNSLTGLLTQSLVAASSGRSTTDIFAAMSKETDKFAHLVPADEKDTVDDEEIDAQQFAEMFNSLQIANRSMTRAAGLAPSMPLAIITPGSAPARTHSKPFEAATEGKKEEKKEDVAESKDNNAAPRSTRKFA